MKKIILSILIVSVAALFQLNCIKFGTDTNSEKIGMAVSKDAALKILNETFPLKNGEYSNAGFTEGDSGYTWDDGSYYCFSVCYISENGEKTMGDIGSLKLVKKNTREVYQMDLEKDISGNTLKRI